MNFTILFQFWLKIIFTRRLKKYEVALVSKSCFMIKYHLLINLMTLTIRYLQYYSYVVVLYFVLRSSLRLCLASVLALILGSFSILAIHLDLRHSLLLTK